MISIFKYYNITPLFVFDGKPPKEKEELLQKRRSDKKIAQEKYEKLKQNMETISDLHARNQYLIEMEKLKKQFIRIHQNDIKLVKQMMDLYGVEYIDAEGESDKICAKMVINKDAWACMSDDMDMFVYGCTRVMRSMNLYQHTVVYYNLDNILRELQLPLHDFREILVLSGTDYNLHQKITLHKSLKYYHDYKQQPSSNVNFYEWLSMNHIKNAEMLYNIHKMFIMDSSSSSNNQDNTEYKLIKTPKKINTKKLREWLSNHGFVFV